MKIDKPTVATGSVYHRDVCENVWTVLELVAVDLSRFDDEPIIEGWGKQYKITVTVEEM